MRGSWLSAFRGTAGDPGIVVGEPLRVGERIYAIGDIHGRADLLDDLRDRIRADLHDRPAVRSELVYLGDYVDRGADSCGVLQRLCEPPADLPPATCLIGNHDHMFLEFIAGHDVGEAFRDFGGFETLQSYGIAPQSLVGRRWSDAQEELLRCMPREHIALLDGLVPGLDRAPYFFCHAGIAPGIPLEEQTAETLFWIRDRFLRSDADHGRIVVHGHTPVRSPEIRRNRIGIDTGAFRTGVLTCAVLEVGTVRLLQTNGA